ncbi:MAG: hypothetical protein ABFC88_12895 [Thermoguttaceae bacterium]
MGQAHHSYPARVWDGSNSPSDKTKMLPGDTAPNGEDWNRIRAEVIATQEKADIIERRVAGILASGVKGTPSLNWRGTWDLEATYAAGDVVERSGSAFVANSSSLNSVPPSSAWDLLVSRGTDGIGDNETVTRLVTEVEGTTALVLTDLPSANANVVWAAKYAGEFCNGISIEYVDLGGAWQLGSGIFLYQYDAGRRIVVGFSHGCPASAILTRVNAADCLITGSVAPDNDGSGVVANGLWTLVGGSGSCRGDVARLDTNLATALTQSQQAANDAAYSLGLAQTLRDEVEGQGAVAHLNAETSGHHTWLCNRGGEYFNETIVEYIPSTAISFAVSDDYRRLEVRFIAGVTTFADLCAAYTALPYSMAVKQLFTVTADWEPETDSQAVIVADVQPMTGGVGACQPDIVRLNEKITAITTALNGVPATVTTGGWPDAMIVYTAKTRGTLLNGWKIRHVRESGESLLHATVDADAREIVVDLGSGAWTAAQVVELVSADDAVAAWVSLTINPWEGGSNYAAVGEWMLSGGLDPTVSSTSGNIGWLLRARMPLEIGVPVYATYTEGDYKASAGDEGKSKVVGLCRQGCVNGGIIVTDGCLERDDWAVITGESHLVPGAIYYLGVDAGMLTVSAPIAGFVVEIGSAISETCLALDIKARVRL